LGEHSQATEEKTQDDATVISSTTAPNSCSTVLELSVPVASKPSDQGRTRRPPTWMRDCHR